MECLNMITEFYINNYDNKRTIFKGLLSTEKDNKYITINL